MKVDFANHYNCSVTLCDDNDGIYDAPTTFEDINAAFADTKAGRVVKAVLRME